MPQRGCRGSRHLWPFWGEEDTEELQFLQAAFEKALRQSKIPPVGHQIKATEEFIGRAKKRLVQHDAAIQAVQESVRKAESLKEEEVKRLSEAEEVLQRLKVQAPVVPTPPPRSVEVLQQMVEQLQIERDALAGQVKHQNSTRMVEKMHPMQGSEDAAQVVLERFAKRRALGEDIPTDQQDLEGWMVSKQLELRDALEMGEIGAHPVACKGGSQNGGFPFNGFQHGHVNQVPSAHRFRYGWRGVRVGEASNPGPVQTRSSRRLAETNQNSSDSFRGAIAVAEPAQQNSECCRWAFPVDGVRRPKRLRIQKPDSGFQNDVDSALLDALEADLLTIPASTVPASSGALRHTQNPQDLEDGILPIVPASSAAVHRHIQNPQDLEDGILAIVPASSAAVHRHIQNPQDWEDGIPATVPASSAAARRMQVPVVSMSDGSGDEEPTHVDVVDEGPDEVSDPESFGRDSDLASVVFSEASTESVEEPAIRPVANARGFSLGLVQLDGFHLTEIFERRAHVMRVVPHVMRAAFCSAIRAACEEICSVFSVG